MTTALSMHRRILSLAGIVILVVAAFLVCPEVRYRAECWNRRHQMGQLWNLCFMYYSPRHGGKFPDDFAQLKSLPEYRAAEGFWDRAIREIDLLAPGADSRTGDPSTLLFREKQADKRGHIFICDLDGSIAFEHGK